MSSNAHVGSLQKTAPSSIPGAYPTDNSEYLKDLVSPHIESFNYAIGAGLDAAIESLSTYSTIVTLDGAKNPKSKKARQSKSNRASKSPPSSKDVASSSDDSSSDDDDMDTSTGEDTLRLWIEEAELGYPTKDDDSLDSRRFPAECRQLGITYNAPLWITICRQVNDGSVTRMQQKVGDIPVMVRSNRCHLNNLLPKELIRRHEDADEFGGYFVCNGIERCIRMLQIPRRNMVQSLDRSAFSNRGPKYSTKATSIRSVTKDQSGTTVTCHYLTDGNVMVRFLVRKQEFFIPLILVLRALKETTDREIYDRLVGTEQTKNKDTFVADHVEVILRDGRTYGGMYSKTECLAYIGARFRILLSQGLSTELMTDAEVGRALLHRYIFVHLSDPTKIVNESADAEKFSLLLFMVRKLFSFVSGKSVEDNSDALSSHEILTPGHLYLKILKEKIEDYMIGVKQLMLADIRRDVSRVNFHDQVYIKRCLDRQKDLGKELYYFLATGNLRSTSGLDLMQATGFTIVAEKLNWLRYIAHFRSVHRGRFFAEMKTTTVRKLLPESWGFLCCVHTPDGSPCGLLSHLCAAARIVPEARDTSNLPTVLTSLGMIPDPEDTRLLLPKMQGEKSGGYLPILLDGRVLGCIAVGRAEKFVEQLRQLKVNELQKKIASGNGECYIPIAAGDNKMSIANNTLPSVPLDLECALIMPMSEEGGGPFPGIFLAAEAARLVRPVYNGSLPELIGPLEQMFMSIGCQDAEPLHATHREISPMNILSVIASLTPFSDMNQSPRNMYQCQMGKQTMGRPCHNIVNRRDNKMYFIQHTQAPIVQNDAQARYRIDDHPNGCNAIVAVISYTGYDMEDAMIISKGSYERGFGHASVYKTKTVDLCERESTPKEKFGKFLSENDENEVSGRGGKIQQGAENIDKDGLPRVGTRIVKGDALYCTVDKTTGHPHYGVYKDDEPCVIDDVQLLGSGGTKTELTKISIKLRYNRNPVVGDKFSSRHGQKGVLSFLYPQQDMPFTESGMSPDIIINPHAFPSRMTIGMLVESMAGKSGALHGKYQNSTPFRFDEKNRAVDYFGEQLKKAGYNYYGSEPMYSGVTGEELQADIFIGCVYYQRLRHMVSDKSQARSIGPVNSLTMQPVKGRKRGGGIRFGEMERDSLISHGTSFLLQDRLCNSSDRHEAWVCADCGSMLGFDYIRKGAASIPGSRVMQEESGTALRCRQCRGTNMKQTAMPYVVRYLANELAAMNIRMGVQVS
eukprot:g4303.t1